MIIMPVWDIGFYFQIVAALLIEENNKILRFFKNKKVRLIIVVIWDYFVWVLYAHLYGFYSIISAILSIKLVTKMAVKAAIMVYKRQWSWKRWYHESLSKAHTTPYQKLGIRL